MTVNFMSNFNKMVIIFFNSIILTDMMIILRKTIIKKYHCILLRFHLTNVFNISHRNSFYRHRINFSVNNVMAVVLQPNKFLFIRFLKFWYYSLRDSNNLMVSNKRIILMSFFPMNWIWLILFLIRNQCRVINRFSNLALIINNPHTKL